jgi:4-hydroxybenzoate polyprenyltransferase
MLPHTPPQTPSQPLDRFSIPRAALVLILTVAIAASSILMVGPQIIVIVPVALVLGLVFAFRRSFWSLVCFG